MICVHIKVSEPSSSYCESPSNSLKLPNYILCVAPSAWNALHSFDFSDPQRSWTTLHDSMLTAGCLFTYSSSVLEWELLKGRETVSFLSVICMDWGPTCCHAHNGCSVNVHLMKCVDEWNVPNTQWRCHIFREFHLSTYGTFHSSQSHNSSQLSGSLASRESDRVRARGNWKVIRG